LLINDVREISNESVSHQHFLLRIKAKSFMWLEAVLLSINLSTSLRGEDGFDDSSNVVDTHNFNIEKDLRSWSM